MMNFKKILHLSIAVLGLVYLTVAVGAEKPGSGKNGSQSLGKISGDPKWQILNINNITTWGRSDGESNHSPGGDNGVYYPVGTGNVVYEDGIVFGSKPYLNAARTTPSQGQKIRVGGSTYLSNVGTKAGYVTGTGAAASAASPDAPDVRYYRVRRDYASMTDGEVRYDAQTSNELARLDMVTPAQMDAIRAQYDKDWKEWPVDKGAPYIERNGKPGYQAPPPFSASFTVDSLIAGNYDEPGVGDPTTPADQVMWTAYNDLDKAQSLHFEGSEPQGIEIQVTSFAYKRTDAMGNCYFKRVRMVNRGGVDLGTGTLGAFYLDSMYVCQWSDIDLGNAGDDLAGCDSALSLGFVYNGNAVDNTFIKFGLPPPASGYDFLAGPAVPGAATDSAVVDFKRVFGKKNLPLSGFSYFSASSPYSDPPFADYLTGTGRWWNMLRGYAPLGTLTDPPVYYEHPPTWWNTKFPLSGDPTKPVGPTNFIDGEGQPWAFVLGDRRILLNTGPFQLNPGDVQEVYVGYVCGIGADRLSSVSVMKANDVAVQTTFDLLFKVAKAPQSPVVKVTELDGEVVLDWSQNAGAVAATETKIAEPGDYAFEGYNVYQFPSAGATLSQGKRLATYDLINDVKVILNEQFDLSAGAFLKVPIQFGSDAGLKRYFRATKDYYKDIDKMYNGQAYYFGVTAYSYTTTPGYIASLESNPNILTAIPKGPVLGSRMQSTAGADTARLVAGISDVKTIGITRINVSQLKSTTYQITFKDTAGATMWILKDKTTGAVVKSSLNMGSNVSGDLNDDNNFPIVDGFIPVVKQIVPVIKTDSSQWIPSTETDLAGGGRLSGGGSWGGYATVASDGPTYLSHFSSSFAMTKLPRIQLRFGPGNGSKAYRLRRNGAGSSYIVRTNVVPAAPNGEGFVTVPFSAWEVGGPGGGGRQLTISWRDQSDDAIWNSTSDGDDLEIIFIHNRSYDPTGGTQFTYETNPNAAKKGTAIVDEATVGTASNPSDIMYMVSLACNDSTYKFTSKPVMYIRPSFAINSSCVYEFSELGPTFSTDVQTTDAKSRVGVFPNPYYAYNNAETSRFDRFVTFNNLPKTATIRIFNLAGQLVRTLDKSSDSQFLRWDLMNARNYPVASGVYIAYIEMPDIGVTKTLKLSVIQQQEILDLY